MGAKRKRREDRNEFFSRKFINTKRNPLILLAKEFIHSGIFWGKPTKGVTELRHLLEAAGHVPIVLQKTMENHGMDVGRVARLVPVPDVPNPLGRPPADVPMAEFGEGGTLLTPILPRHPACPSARAVTLTGGRLCPKPIFTGCY